MMHEIEIILGLLVVVAALAVVAERLAVPYPILLVLGFINDEVLHRIEHDLDLEEARLGG